MTREEKEERIERLRQEPAFKDLMRILRGQQPDRVDEFMEMMTVDTAEGDTDDGRRPESESHGVERRQ